MNEIASYIKKDQEEADDHVDVQTAVLYILSLFGSLAAGWTVDKIDRRWTIIVVGFVFLAGPHTTWLASNSIITFWGDRLLTSASGTHR